MSFIDTIPLETGPSTQDNWVDYIGCVIAVAAADGISASEKAAISSWMQQHGLKESLLEAASERAKKLDIASLKGNPAARFFAPHIVRDAIRMSHIDGQTDSERARILDVGTALGLTAAEVGAIEAVVNGHETAERLWKSLTASR